MSTITTTAVDEVDLLDDAPDQPPLARLHDDDRGAQAMEYAMLGGAGVASVSVLTWILNQDWFRESIEQFIGGLFTSLGERVMDLLPSVGGLF